MKILFICTGNICRSPTAHAIARHKAQENNVSDKFFFDSAGTDAYHVGGSPDRRTAEVGQKRGVSFAGIKARQITAQDFEDFDLIFAMTRGHFRHLLGCCEPENSHKIKLFLDYCDVDNKWDDEVIDPYYGHGKGFIEVFDKIETGIDNLLEILEEF